MFPSLSKPFLCATFAVALLFSITSVLPHILQRFDREYPFQGIEMTLHDAEGHYTARVREVYDGYPRIANLVVAFPKNQASLVPSLPERVIAGIGKLFFLDAARALVFSKFYLAFALAVCMIAFLCSLTKRPWESLLAVTALLFVGALLGSPWDVKKWILLDFQSFPPLRFTRPTSPLWHSTIFFAALFLLSSWVSKRQRIMMVIAGALTSVLLYSSVYAWTSVGAIMSVLFVWYLWKRDRARMKDMLIFAGVFLLLGIPYFLNLWEAMHHAGYLDTARRFGFIPSRAPMFSAWLSLFLVFTLLTRKILPTALPFVAALSIGGVIALNEQVLSGMYIMNHHYHWYFTGPVAQLFCVVFALVLLQRCIAFALGAPAGRPYVPFLKKWGTVLLLILGVSFGINQQTQAYLSHKESTGKEQLVAPLIRFLNENEEKGKAMLIVGEDDIHFLLLSYTSVELTGGTKAGAYLQTDAQLRDSLFLDLWAGGLTSADAQLRFFSDLRDFFGKGIHGIYYRELLGEGDFIPEEELQELVLAYRQYYQLPLKEKIQKHGLGSILILPDAKETAALGSLRAAGSPIYEEGGYTVIRLTPVE